ncbi:hypothetical protein E1A91_A05G434700v1 [Gossypium mustelinum]|uniref:Uncharacterized protein n=1 Tax=Gossypium mustelinum TaxID=34275 RepID=A0A5D2ZIA8_GOSMU|nr:hypothetical protein E1A91_A05G434700v1 [Gossypium mustelinum]
MSLISQNPVSRNKVKFKRDDEVVSINGDINDTENGLESDSEISKLKKRKKEKENQIEVEQEKEIKKLESFLFGSIYSPLEFGKQVEEKAHDVVAQDGSALFFLDSSTNDVELSEESDYEQKTCKERKAVWVDEEEERTVINIAKVNRLRKLRKEEDESVISGLEYVSRLRAQHAKLNPGTEWAKLDSGLRNDHGYDDESSDEEKGVVAASGYGNGEVVDDILRTNEDLVVKSRVKLLPGLLEYSRLVDANAEEPSNGPINSVQFHRNAQLLLAAGLDRRIRFFQIDGKRNTKIQSVFLEDCPIGKASFLPDMKAKVDKIGPLVGREEKSLEVFEISPDSSTIAFLGNEVRSLAFADNGNQLLSSGGDGEVYHWDLRTRTCIHKAVDEGCINGTSLCTSPNARMFAAGSDSGIVNVYNRDEFLGGKRKQIKTVENLTTKVDFMKFNSDAQMLAICSTMKKNSLKLIHVPSFTVYSNWPPLNKNLQYPRCLDFNPGGGFMAVGNAAGKVLLYKLHHYNHA